MKFAIKKKKLAATSQYPSKLPSAQKMDEAVSQLEDICNQLELINFDEVISCIEIAKE